MLSLFIVYIPGTHLPQGPKGLKGPKGPKGLKGPKGHTVGASAYGRMRNEELRRRQIRGCETDKTFESLRMIVVVETGRV